MAGNNELTDDGIEFDDGRVLEWPDCDGTIRCLDPHGDCEQVRRPGDDGYEDWLALFPVDEIEVEYRVTLRTTMRLPKGRYRLAHEIEEIQLPEDACTHPVAGTFELLGVTRNGSRAAPPAPRDRHPPGPIDAAADAGAQSVR